MFDSKGVSNSHPGYVDLQINGLARVDFNANDLDASEWNRARRALWADGTSHFLPTLITDSLEGLHRKLRRLALLCQSPHEESDSGHATAVGIHLEGPYLSSIPGYIGAHSAAHARSADLEVTKRLFESAAGTLRLVTLAPECDPTGASIRFLVDHGILVAAGHTDASLDELKRAIDAGLSLFTHLGNACPQVLHRHDNIVHRVLSLRDRLRVTLIADGHHLPWWLLRAWIDDFGPESVSIVSDAISAAGLPPGIHRLGDLRVAVGSDGVPRSQDGSHFVGSGSTLGVMAKSLEMAIAVPIEVRTQIFTTNARNWLGIDSTV